MAEHRRDLAQVEYSSECCQASHQMEPHERQREMRSGLRSKSLCRRGASVMPSCSPPKVLLEIDSLGGHRASYLELFGQLVDGVRTTSLWRMLLARQPLLFLTLEGSFGKYSFLAPMRALLGRRTVGLLLRPGPALRGTSFRLRTKRFLLKMLRRIPYVQTLTILPFSVEPRFSEIANGWIYDPQLWDLDDDTRTRVQTGGTELAASIRMAATKRRICVAIGTQHMKKGYDRFVQLYSASQGLRRRMLFASGGKVSEELSLFAKKFEDLGGYSLNRFITHEELLDFYAAADIVWCAYNPGYDQASGIFGRAVQLGLPVIVRRDSYLHRLSNTSGIEHIAIGDDDDVNEVGAELERVCNERSGLHVEQMRQRSVARIQQALGLT